MIWKNTFRALLWILLGSLGWAAGRAMGAWHERSRLLAEKRESRSATQALPTPRHAGSASPAAPKSPDAAARRASAAPEKYRIPLLLAMGLGDIERTALALEALKLLGQDPVETARSIWDQASEEGRRILILALAKASDPGKADLFFLDLLLSEAKGKETQDKASPLAQAAFEALMAGAGNAQVAETLFGRALGSRGWLAKTAARYVQKDDFEFSREFVQEKLLEPARAASTDLARAALIDPYGDGVWRYAARHLWKSGGEQAAQLRSIAVSIFATACSPAALAIYSNPAAEDQAQQIDSVNYEWFALLFDTPPSKDRLERQALADDLTRTLVDWAPHSNENQVDISRVVSMFKTAGEEGALALLALLDHPDPAVRRVVAEVGYYYYAPESKEKVIDGLRRAYQNTSDPTLRCRLLENLIGYSNMCKSEKQGEFFLEAIKTVRDPEMNMSDRELLYGAIRRPCPNAAWDAQSLQVMADVMCDPGFFAPWLPADLSEIQENLAELLVKTGSPFAKAEIQRRYRRCNQRVRKVILLETARGGDLMLLDILTAQESDPERLAGIRFLKKQVEMREKK